MTMHCALCGRAMHQAAVMIGKLPVGPKCAQRAGLMPLARRKVGLVSLATGHKSVPKRDTQTLDLFTAGA